ncbi:ketosteroid isomerase-like protein [Crossiella equi]|uniref:Ketosteroid isomerase-like protein n=1 Tax=Crossiella equi TaxID=130796 RepID=A0ABS5A7B2_9PSEU|nr:nuclear transport factor 2 family protein [Crossiella equi]MBP2472478.1 ketosteroid isomerase-like protein [Crossiella equi]
MTRTPEQTVNLMLARLLAKDMDGVADLWALEGVAEFPFAAAGSPPVVHGREAIRQYLANYPELLDVREVPAKTVHHTTDPDTVVVEFTAQGLTVRTGQPYELSYIAVVTTADGEITRYRDYWSPVAVAAALGELPALLTALAEESA